ncbi:hypothetical protein KUTeg_022029 [Tegillarca granosa]|uniref:HTH CENPB-type domain-containing protein n=1 Tax=Tegillarca granosa TaxID=220873 RepID=A0ABQ9EAL4_TEGGR|nr:hypothetical protein KUTeg_022029 [Tegillarca granosa]
MPPKRISLSLDQRLEVIKGSENDNLSARKIAQIYGVGRNQIDNILKRKAEVLSDYENNVPSDRKRQRRPTGNEDINELMWEWFQDATKRRININGPLLQERALMFAKDLYVESFKASNGWLESFKNRHNIVFGTMSGERGDVIDCVVEDWKRKLPRICEELLKEINVLQAIYWINSAWKEVELSTIQKCFVKCGFKDIETNDEDSDIDDDISLSVVALANELSGCDFHDLVELDREWTFNITLDLFYVIITGYVLFSSITFVNYSVGSEAQRPISLPPATSLPSPTR